MSGIKTEQGRNRVKTVTQFRHNSTEKLISVCVHKHLISFDASPSKGRGGPFPRQPLYTISLLFHLPKFSFPTLLSCSGFRLTSLQ